jgi:hypothetical protein
MAAPANAMTRIVRSHYRYKPPQRLRAKAAPIEGTAIVTIDHKTRRKVSDEAKATPVKPTPANDDRKLAPTKPPPPAAAGHPSAIVTARRPGKRYAEVPEVSEEEHRRVGDLADAMMQEFKRVIAEKTRH